MNCGKPKSIPRHDAMKNQMNPKTESRSARLFFSLVVDHPKIVLACLLVLVAVMGFFAKDFKIDASAETLIQESDADLRYSRIVASRYGVQDFLVIAYTPRDDLLSDKVLADIGRLKDELAALPRVASVVTLLDVPMLESPPLEIQELAGEMRTLLSPGVDREMARKELANSPLYRNLLVSPDLKTTGIQINFPPDDNFYKWVMRRDQLDELAAARGLSPEESAEYRLIIENINGFRAAFEKNRNADIAAIRAIMDHYRADADLFLGGVSMIADDLVRFVKNDLKIFGIGVFAMLIIVLSIIFRQPRWVILPMLCCGFSAVIMMGLLGLIGWKVTVVSSNFISIQLVLTMSLTIHLIVRYREFMLKDPRMDQRALVHDTVSTMVTPCFYNSLTTIAGFSSLVYADIVPVVSFGYMMTAGVAVSFIFTFLFFPASLMLVAKPAALPPRKIKFALPLFMARFTEVHRRTILVLTVIALMVSAVGLTRLTVENSFINYFKEDTEIYQGMAVIDRQLGGTTPLDVIVNLEAPVAGASENIAASGSEAAAADESSVGADNFGEPDEFDDFADFDEFADDIPSKYWFTPFRMHQVEEIHDYLNAQPEIGKVLSLGSMMKIADRLTDGRELDSFELSLIYNEIPDEYRDLLITPYVSVENDEVRFFVRVRDSEESLRRNELINRIGSDLVEKLGYPEENVRLTGMMILYNNMLQSLFDTQIQTLGFVLLVIMIMFFVLFRSFPVAVIAIFPNLLSIAVVLSFMGWMGIPLDMMTITIASISVGIAVDDTIHFIYRFRTEIANGKNYIQAMHRSHNSIGFAMFYTSITIIIGFSVLTLSNFIPTILFGLLIGLAMLIAIISALTLLPALIIMIKPFGPEEEGAAA
jgi:uncharacterized protein